MLPMSLLPESTDFPVGGSGGGELILDEERSLAMELAMSSMDELLKMCHGNEPLWVRNSSNSMDVLNIEEYTRMFPWPHHHVDPLKPHYNDLRTEATRDKALVIMNSINLVDSFLDAVSPSYYLYNNKIASNLLNFPFLTNGTNCTFCQIDFRTNGWNCFLPLSLVPRQSRYSPQEYLVMQMALSNWLDFDALLFLLS